MPTRERYFPGADVYLVREDGEVDLLPITTEEAAELAEADLEANYFAVYMYAHREVDAAGKPLCP
jgi:hypothetical protein